MAGSIQEQDPPLWLAAATRTKSLSTLPNDFPIIDLTPEGVRDGPLNLDQDEDMNSPADAEVADSTERQYESLDAQLDRYSSQKATSTLHIKGDAPTASQFALISSAFPNVKQLYIQTGIFERWSDDGFPSNSTWPLELLVISDACGEVITAEPVINGEIEHLVFYLTHNLRFEGSPDVTEDPDDASQWLANTTTGLAFYETPVSTGSKVGSKLKKLEILENDAIETLVRFTVAHFDTVRSIEELTIRSLHGTDMIYLPGGILGAVLPRLENIKYMDLSLCHYIYFQVAGLEDDKDAEMSLAEEKSPSEHWLIDGLPPNLETFYFRGPTAIATENGGRWLAEWARGFSNADYLPRLTKLGFWLDQLARQGADDEEVAPHLLEEIQDARTKVEEILGPVLGKRGIQLVDWDEKGAWRDPWFDEDWPDYVMDKED